MSGKNFPLNKPQETANPTTSTTKQRILPTTGGLYSDLTQEKNKDNSPESRNYSITTSYLRP